MVICYCLSAANLSDPPARSPRLAKRIELDQMYDELTAVLVDIGYMNPQNPRLLDDPYPPVFHARFPARR